MEVGLQIFNRGRLACRLADSCNDKMPQDIILDPVEPDAVIYLVQYHLGAI